MLLNYKCHPYLCPVWIMRVSILMSRKQEQPFEEINAARMAKTNIMRCIFEIFMFQTDL